MFITKNNCFFSIFHCTYCLVICFVVVDRKVLDTIRTLNKKTILLQIRNRKIQTKTRFPGQKPLTITPFPPQPSTLSLPTCFHTKLYPKHPRIIILGIFLSVNCAVSLLMNFSTLTLTCSI